MDISHLAVRTWEIVVLVVILLGVGNLGGVLVGILAGLAWILFVCLVRRLVKRMGR
jgi:hypothetical protein